MSDVPQQFIFARDEVIQDPYPYYDDIRARGPVQEIADGVFFVARHAECAAALTDRRLSNRPAPFALLHSRNQDQFVGADIAQSLIAFRDAPDVTRARKALATEFAAFTRTTGAVLKDEAQASLAPLATATSMDFVQSIAMPYAIRTMCRILGFPIEDTAKLKAWSADFFYLFHAIPDRDTLVRLNSTLADFRTYTAQIVSARRQNPQNDLISKLCMIDESILDDGALIDNIMLFAADGVENVWAGIANALALITTNYDAVATHLANGTGWGPILTECLRIESPGQYQGRIALEELELGGVRLRKYSVVLVGLACANRDPIAFPTPTEIIPNRKGAKDLAFGLGPHACLGRALVNMQMLAIFEALEPHLARLTCQLTPDLWDGRAGHRWLSALPIELEAKTTVEETQFL